MARFFYNFFQYLLFPLVVLRMLWRSRRAPAYRQRLVERLGYIPAPAGMPCIWVHAVSVGETLAAAPMVTRLLADYPGFQVVLTTTTPTGSERVSALFGDTVLHCYAPYDMSGAVRRFLDRVRPQALIVMETELWPNMLHQVGKRRIPVLLANARLSARSAKGYRRVAALTRPMMRQLDQVAAQTDDDGARFLELGLDQGKLTVTGSIKWDIQLADDLKAIARELRLEWRSDERPVLVAASTHPGEEAILLSAAHVLREEFPTLLLVLVPRHPERFEEVFQLAMTSAASVARRSQPGSVSAATQVLIGDTMGELMAFFGASRLAFVGGSLIPHGGHNLLEPAAWGRAILTGPHTFNFDRVTRLLSEAGAALVVADENELTVQLRKLLAEEGRVRAMGESARQMVASNRGALDRLLALVPALLDQE